MRVAFFIPSMDTGGAERVTLNLLQALEPDESLELDLVLCHARGGYLKRVPERVNVVDLGVSRIATSLVPLGRWMRRAKPDVVLSALVTANIVACAASAFFSSDTRLVVAEHNDFGTALSNAKNRRAKIAPYLMGLTYPGASHVIAVSEGVAKGLRQTVDDLEERTHLSVVPNPVINSEVRAKVNGEPDHPWLREKDGPVALAVGRLQAQKNFALLIDAMNLLGRHHGLRLVIHGEGPDHAALQQQIDALGLSDRIALAGLTSNPYAAMRAADMLVMSSKFEGLPTVLIEALFCGTAVISTNCPSGPDEILAGGRYGTLVPMDDAASLADAMATQLRTPRGPNPPESWERYTEEVVVQTYRRILGI